MVTELRESFDKYGYLLSSAVSPSKLIIDKGKSLMVTSSECFRISEMVHTRMNYDLAITVAMEIFASD